MKKILLLAALVVLGGCSEEGPTYPSSAGATSPYILKEGCEFTIIADQGSAGVSSPEVSGSDMVSATMSVSIGDLSIEVGDCMVVDNPHDLSIYED